MALMIDLVNSETGEMVRFTWGWAQTPNAPKCVSVFHFSKINGTLNTSDTLDLDQARLRWKELIRNGFHKLNSQPLTC